jgi:hypothetical protein
MARLPPPPPPPDPRRTVKPVAQRAAAATFAPTKRVTGRPQGTAEELVGQPDGTFRVRSADRGTLQQPNGVYNFVRVQEGTRRGDGPLLVSPRMPHAHIAGGRPVIYAGTARLDAGKLDWWSNFSGTYQPIAEFRSQARLPNDKFVNWQKLQLSGVSMQRGMLGERRKQQAPGSNSVKAEGGPAEPAAKVSGQEAGGKTEGKPAGAAKVVGGR